MPSGSTTMVRYPAPFRSGTSLRKPNSDPNSPGMRTTGGPAPEVSTCRDSVAARGILKLWRSAVSASSATARSQTIVPSGFERGRKAMSRSPARFNRRWDSGGSEGLRSGPGRRRRRGWKPVEQLVQDLLLVLQEALVAVDEQRGRAPLRVSGMTDFVLVESERRAERQHGPNDALVMFGDGRETGPQRRQLARQPDALSEALPKCVGRA